MTLSLPQFVDALSASGLMTADELSAFRARLPEAASGSDTEALARELVRQGKLTSFQVNAVYQGKTRGLVFGEYMVLDKLGAGGMGRVFRARHRRMDRIVALKVLPREALDSPQAVERFEREVRAAARLLHPNIVTAYDASIHEGIHYLVMEYVPGRDLGTIVREGGPLEIRRAIDYAIQAARGLQFAHEQGIVHRDIKPANLLLSIHGTVKILDMGLARVDEGAFNDSKATRIEGLTRTGQVLGTLDYMAPEQAEDVNAADARSDVYGLGCTLFRFLTGRPPYQADSVLRKLLAHREQTIPDVRQDRPEAPAELAEALQQMLAKLPEDRPASMQAVIALLERVPTAAPTAAAQPAVATTADAADEDKELSGFFHRVEQLPPSRPLIVGAASRVPARPRKQRSLRLPLALLGLLGALIAIPLAAKYWDRRPATIELEWSPNQRADARFEVDGQPMELPQRGAVVFSVPAGARKVEILRRGFEPNQWEVELAPGERKLLIPRWTPAKVSGSPSAEDIQKTRRPGAPAGGAKGPPPSVVPPTAPAKGLPAKAQ
ncbi:MAG: serine/threonine-protein kinase [Pirellulales bacterium]